MSEVEALSPEKRAQVLQGATTVFSRDGYEGASMSRIAQQAGVSKGTLYNYYENKADLFAACIAGQCSATLAQALEPALASARPEEVLRNLGTRMMELMLSPKALTIFRVVASEAPKFPELSQAFYQAGPARAIGTLAGWLAAETTAGRLDVPRPQIAAEQFFSLCQAGIWLRQVLHVDPPIAPAEIAAVVGNAVEVFLQSYRRPASPPAGGMP